MYKIAFHLAKGKNFQHWQIKDKDNNCTYVNPKENDLILYNCKLKNQFSASKKIFHGADKLRCAWVQFESFEIIEKSNYTSDIHIQFNPRKCPTWKVNDSENQDNREFKSIKSNNNQLYQF